MLAEFEKKKDHGVCVRKSFLSKIGNHPEPVFCKPPPPCETLTYMPVYRAPDAKHS